MTWYLVLVSLTLLGLSNGVITKRSNHNQNFQHYEIQTFAASNPVSNIIDAISAPLNILADQLTRQPGAQQFIPGLGQAAQRGPPGFLGPPGHRHHNHGPPGQRQNNPFYYPPPPQPQQRPLPPYLANLPSREQFNRPGTQFPQGQFPQNPNFFPFGQNYPKPGFANNPGNSNGNTNNIDRGNTGCNGFCQPSQPQRPNQFGGNGFNGNNFGVTPNNAQTNNGLGTPNVPSQENGLVHSTFGGFGTDDGSQTPQSQPGNQFGAGGINNNNFGGSPNIPQNNNGFGTPNRPMQGNGLIQSTFGGFGTDGNQTPQSQQGNQFGNGGFNNNNFGGSPNIPQTNNNFGTPNMPSQNSGLIQTTFGGFETNGNQIPQSNNVPAAQNGQTNGGNVIQPTKPPGNDDLVSSIFGKQPDSGSSTQTQTQPQSNSNDTGDLISSVFAGFPQNPQANNNENTGSQISSPSNGNDLIQGVFPGFATSAPPVSTGNNVPTTTEMIADAKSTNDLIESIFTGINDNNGQNVPQTDVIGTSTVPPSTTNSNGFIYDIDVRSS